MAATPVAADGNETTAGEHTATPTESGDGAGTTEDARSPFSTVEFSNQATDGTSLTIDATVLSDGGYVAIHDATLFEGQVVESVVGVTEYLEPGPHYRVPVTLFDVPGGNFDRQSLDETAPLIAMPHRETSGNSTYDFVQSGGESDGPYAEAELPAVDAAFAVVAADGEEAMGTETDTPGMSTPPNGAESTETPTATPTPSNATGTNGTATPTPAGTDGESTPFATVDFENQALAEGAVTVAETVLSHGGFVTLHDARLLGGDAFGSVVGVSNYLEPGRHHGVSVPIDDPSGLTQVALPAPPVIPMPHMDTDGNQSYDFVTSEGTEDGPYTKAGQAVIDAGLVTTE